MGETNVHKSGSRGLTLIALLALRLDQAGAVVGEQHLLPERGIAAALRSKG
jgi:hypothetical protein